MSDKSQENGVSELSKAFHRVVKEAVAEGIEPVLELIHESEERLDSRMETMEKNVQSQLVAQHKETIEQVRRINKRGY